MIDMKGSTADAMNMHRMLRPQGVRTGSPTSHRYMLYPGVALRSGSHLKKK